MRNLAVFNANTQLYKYTVWNSDSQPCSLANLHLLPSLTFTLRQQLMPNATLLPFLEEMYCFASRKTQELRCTVHLIMRKNPKCFKPKPGRFLRPFNESKREHWDFSLSNNYYELYQTKSVLLFFMA